MVDMFTFGDAFYCALFLFTICLVIGLIYEAVLLTIKFMTYALKSFYSWVVSNFDLWFKFGHGSTFED